MLEAKASPLHPKEEARSTRGKERRQLAAPEGGGPVGEARNGCKRPRGGPLKNCSENHLGGLPSFGHPCAPSQPSSLTARADLVFTAHLEVILALIPFSRIAHLGMGITGCAVPVWERSIHHTSIQQYLIYICSASS